MGYPNPVLKIIPEDTTLKLLTLSNRAPRDPATRNTQCIVFLVVLFPYLFSFKSGLFLSKYDNVSVVFTMAACTC